MAYDSRILHVSTKYKQYTQLDMSANLKKLHDDMYKHFSKIAKGKTGAGMGSAAEAQELQTFFQILKQSTSKNGMSQQTKDIFDAAASEQEQKIISNMIGHILEHTSEGATLRKRLFRQTGDSQRQGSEFEKELAAVIGAVNSVTSNTSGKVYTKQIAKAATKANWGKIDTGLNPEMLDQLGKEIISETFNNIKLNNGHNALSLYVDQYKDGKIDASGLSCQWRIVSTATPYLNKIANLLSTASFTAKSYRSHGTVAGEWVKTKYRELGLGTTELSRVFLTVFQGAGFAPPVAFSMYKYIINTSDLGVQMWASRLRFVYELTGYGQHYGNNVIQDFFQDTYGVSPYRANYIIYNDPSTDDIFVRSTADIIQEVWESIENNLMEKRVELSKLQFS